MDKKDEEQHSMSKPKPLEEVSDGDLSEIKKDPVWKTWLEKKEDWDKKERDLERKARKEKEETPLEKYRRTGIKPKRSLHPSKDTAEHLANIDRMLAAHKRGKIEEKEEQAEANVSDANKTYVTKPIPDSKGGKGSFQHCINANQDKHNPGGWCKQIERKIGKGKDEGESEEVKISMYEKLRRIKDRLQSHKKKAKKQTKIDRKGEWFDPSKIGTNTGWDDDPMNKPSYFQARMEEERKKREKKKAKNKRPPIKGISAYQQGPKKMEVTSPHGKGQQTGGKETGEGWQKYWNEHKDELLSHEEKKKKEKKKGEKVEEPESDYYMDAGGNPQRKEKTDKQRLSNDEKLRRVAARLETQAKRRQGKKLQTYQETYDKTPELDTGEYVLNPKGEASRRSSADPKNRIVAPSKKPREGNWKKTEAEAELVEANVSDANKADYFVEEIRSNIIYHNKIFPLIGMIAGQAARGMGKMGKKLGGEILEGASELGQGMLQGVAEEEEEQ